MAEVDNPQDSARLELLGSAVNSARETIKASLLANSGAAVALLALMGHLIGVKEKFIAASLAPTFLWFIAGLIFAILGHFASYRSNLNFSRNLNSRIAQIWRGIGLGLVIVSLALFVGGACLAYSVLISSLLANSTITGATAIQVLPKEQFMGMDPNWVTAIATVIIAISTIVYVVGTFLLWRATKRVLVLNTLSALRDQHFIERPTLFLKLAKQAIPEIDEIMKQVQADVVDEAPGRKD